MQLAYVLQAVTWTFLPQSIQCPHASGNGTGCWPHTGNHACALACCLPHMCKAVLSVHWQLVRPMPGSSRALCSGLVA
jgi:hypothetical protein